MDHFCPFRHNKEIIIKVCNITIRYIWILNVAKYVYGGTVKNMRRNKMKLEEKY